jgi:hypothetical protein
LFIVGKGTVALLRKPIRHLAFAFMLVIAAPRGVFAQERQFADYNCAITFPDGWHLMTNLPPQQSVLAAYGDAAGTRLVYLLIFAKKPTGPLDDHFISEYERGIQESGGGERLSGKFIEIAGIKSYERLGSLLIRGKRASMIGQLVPADGRFYNLQAMRFDGDANDDPEIRQILGSFRFIRPPDLSYTPDSIAYRMGQLTGFLLVILAIVAVVVALVRRDRTPQPKRPPPLPPNKG